MEKRKKFSIQAVIIAVLIMVVISSFIFYAQATAKNYIQSETEKLAEITSLDADAFTVYFDAKLALSESLSRSLSHTPRDSWSTILSQAGQISGSGAFIIDATGKDVLSGDGIGIEQSLVGACFTGCESGLIGPGYDPVTGKRSTFAYSTFTASDGQALLILTSIDNESLYEEITLSVYGGEGYSYIVDSGGYTVLYSKQPRSNKTFSSILNLLDERRTNYLHGISKISDLESALKNSVSGVGYYRHDGRDCVVSVAPIRIPGGWSVITVVDETYLYSQISQVLIRTLVVLAIVVGCFLITGIMIFTSGKRSRRIQSINEQLEAAIQETERANRAKTDFLSHMSHDIRTPMNTIVNLTRLIEDEIDDRDAALKDLRRMETSNEFLLTLINDILDMSRIEQARLELHPERYEYEEFIDYISSTFTPLCEEKSIHFVLGSARGHIAILVDKVRFNQICFNLLSNAVKYTPAGGTVVFKILNGEIADGHVCCEIIVSDTGIGMSKEFQSHMFESFEREADSMAAVQGTGLGLSIVKELVELMGGTIAVDSQKGKGTDVHIHLKFPVAPEAEKAIPKEAVSLAILRGKRVLIVEDHPMNRQIVQRLLQKVGISSTLAGNGEKAVEIFQKDSGQYDAILMDMRMPVMDGLEATRRIRQLDKQNATTVPIIAMTANAFDEDVRKCLEAGMNAHIGKPIDVDQLYQRLAEWIHP